MKWFKSWWLKRKLKIGEECIFDLLLKEDSYELSFSVFSSAGINSCYYRPSAKHLGSMAERGLVSFDNRIKMIQVACKSVSPGTNGLFGSNPLDWLDYLFGPKFMGSIITEVANDCDAARNCTQNYRPDVVVSIRKLNGVPERIRNAVVETVVALFQEKDKNLGSFPNELLHDLLPLVGPGMRELIFGCLVLKWDELSDEIRGRLFQYGMPQVDSFSELRRQRNRPGKG